MQLRLKSSNEFVVGDETVAAGTTLYFDANLESDTAAARVAALSGEGSRLDGLDDGLRLRGGKIKVLQQSQLSLALGVAEFTGKGSFSAQPAAPARSSL